MMYILKHLFLVLMIVVSACKENQLTSLDKDETAESKWFDYLQLLNKKEFSSAIDLLAEIPDEIKLKRENLVRHSSAYAGFCGLDLLTIVDGASGLDGKTPTQFFMSTFTEPSPEKLAACQTAISILEENVSIDASLRNREENIAVMSYFMISIGLFLNSKFDLDNDNIIDTGADSCSSSEITDIEVAQLGSVLTKMFLAAQSIAEVDVLDEIQSDIQKGCDGLSELSPQLNFCNNIDPSSFTGSQLQGVRSLIQEGVTFGMGSCTSSPNDLENCVCL